MNRGERYIGQVLEVEGRRIVGSFVISPPTGDSDAPAVCARETPAVGRFVAVSQAQGILIAMVQAVHGEASSDSNRPEGRLILNPIGEISTDGVFRRGVTEFPVIGAPICGVSPDAIAAIFSRLRPFNFSLGHLKAYPDAQVFLDPNGLCGRHFAILGQSGSGKSWAVAALIQNLVESMPSAHIILLDLHGEYCWVDEAGVAHSAFRPEQVRHLDARELEIPYWLMTFGELVDLLIDRGDEKAPIQTAFLRDVVLALKRDSAKTIGLPTVSVDSPVYFPLDAVYEQFKEANELRTDFGKTRGPLFGQFDEFLIKLQSRLSDARYDFLYNPRRRTRSESLGDLLRDFVGLGEPRCAVSVIDLSAVPFDVRPTISAQIGRLAFEFNYWNPRNREFPILLVCEEAHVYIPRDPGSTYTAARKSMERIAKEGRKYGVGLGVVTQRPQELSETVLSQCGTYLCLRLSNPDDQAYVRQLVPEGESDFVGALTTLGRGEAMILGEAVPLPIRLRLVRPDPTPNSNDVDYHHAWRDGLQDLDLDAVVRRWWRQGR